MLWRLDANSINNNNINKINFMEEGTCFTNCNCGCDLDREKVGTSAWYLLHEIVKHGDDEYEHAFRTLMHTLSVLYPCKECRAHIKEYIGTHRVEMSEQWMCDFHNDVNVRLGKPIFNCTI